MPTAEQRSHHYLPSEPKFQIVPRSIPSPVRFQHVRSETKSRELNFDRLSVLPILNETPPLGTMLTELNVLGLEILRPKPKNLINLDPQIQLTIQSPFLLEKSRPTHLLVATEIIAFNQPVSRYQTNFTQLERLKLQPNGEFCLKLAIGPENSLLPFQVRFTISNPLRYQDQPLCQTLIITSPET